MPQEVIKKNHMDVAWHEYTDENGENVPVVDSSIAEKASIIGRVGIMFLSCGTGAWRVRSSMNTLAEALGITCTEDIGLMSIEYTCYDGENGFTQSLCLTNTGVNTLKLNRLEHFIRNFEKEGNLGITLPRNDETITTKEGDLILYLGNKLCLYYNQNTWDFTKLGHIKDTTHLKEVLGKGSVQVALLMK
mgnify:CR=1 FL=1